MVSENEIGTRQLKETQTHDERRTEVAHSNASVALYNEIAKGSEKHKLVSSVTEVSEVCCLFKLKPTKELILSCYLAFRFMPLALAPVRKRCNGLVFFVILKEMIWEQV